MFCMYIDRGFVGTRESKLCSVCVLTKFAFCTVESMLRSACVLTEGVLLQARVSYVRCLYCHMVPCYRGDYVMFCMCIDRKCVVSGESKLCSLCVTTDGSLVPGRVIYVLYVY